MADIFNRASDVFGGSFAADAALVNFAQPGLLSSTTGASPAVGMLVQNLQFNYQQQVTRIYEIGTQFTFYVAGRTQGQLSMGRVLGPRPVALAFYRKYGDVCEAATNSLDIQLSTGCQVVGQNKQLYAFTMKFVVITSIGVTMTAQDMIVNEQLQAMFASLDLTTPAQSVFEGTGVGKSPPGIIQII